jgi:hypothetical protein
MIIHDTIVILDGKQDIRMWQKVPNLFGSAQLRKWPLQSIRPCLIAIISWIVGRIVARL